MYNVYRLGVKHKRLGTSRQMINKIIHGRKNITLREIKEIAQILDLDINELMEEEQKLSADPVVAFTGSVKTKAAEEGLKTAKKVMDLIIFHRDIQEEFNNILNE
ncbi:MAG: helix-turn-helix domain-containing protein [Halanaerobium sp.]